MRPLALALVVSGVAAGAAHATPITGSVLGTVTANRSGTDAPSRQFAVGEAVLLRFAYDAEATPNYVEFRLNTAGGFALEMPTRSSDEGRASFEDDGSTLLRQSEDIRTITLKLWDDAGEMEYSEGFLADVVRVEVGGAVPNPEPSTLVMGLVGAALAGLHRGKTRGVA